MADNSSNLMAQYFRLLITLSSGAVILVATFLRDLFKTPVVGLLLQIALGAFAICILFSVWSFFLEAVAERLKSDGFSPRETNVLLKSWKPSWLFWGTLLTFVLGITFLSMFASWNLAR